MRLEKKLGCLRVVSFEKLFQANHRFANGSGIGSNTRQGSRYTFGRKWGADGGHDIVQRARKSFKHWINNLVCIKGALGSGGKFCQMVRTKIAGSALQRMRKSSRGCCVVL